MNEVIGHLVHIHTYWTDCCTWTTEMVSNDIIRYDTIHCIYVRHKSWQIASLICRTERNKKCNEGTKNKKKRDAKKKRPNHKFCIVSTEAKRESMVGNIRERGRFWAGSERERGKLRMVRVVSWQSAKMC